MITSDKDRRKDMPVMRGLLDYFPLACLAVADLSRVGNEQHNPGEPMHWAREKSTDQVDCIVRHLMQRGYFDSDGIRHSAKAAWRALASLQLEIEADGNYIAEEDTKASDADYENLVQEVQMNEGLRRPQRMGRALV